MALIPVNNNVPFDITRLSHVVLTSRDLEATRDFYETGLGLEVTFQDDAMLCMRASEEGGHHSLMFEKNRSPGTGRRASCRLSDVYRRRSETCPWLVWRTRPDGGVLRHDGLVREPDAALPHACRGRLAIQDHVQIACHHVAGAYQFYSDMGFRLTEYTAKDGTDDMWGCLAQAQEQHAGCRLWQRAGAPAAPFRLSHAQTLGAERHDTGPALGISGASEMVCRGQRIRRHRREKNHDGCRPGNTRRFPSELVTSMKFGIIWQNGKRVAVMRGEDRQPRVLREICSAAVVDPVGTVLELIEERIAGQLAAFVD
jgi:catechol 2,3-dioxygenase-like lactoylglutathione lyase family enzyme